MVAGLARRRDALGEPLERAPLDDGPAVPAQSMVPLVFACGTTANWSVRRLHLFQLFTGEFGFQRSIFAFFFFDA